MFDTAFMFLITFCPAFGANLKQKSRFDKPTFQNSITRPFRKYR